MRTAVGHSGGGCMRATFWKPVEALMWTVTTWPLKSSKPVLSRHLNAGGAPDWGTPLQYVLSTSEWSRFDDATLKGEYSSSAGQ